MGSCFSTNPDRLQTGHRRHTYSSEEEEQRRQRRRRIHDAMLTRSGMDPRRLIKYSDLVDRGDATITVLEQNRPPNHRDIEVSTSEDESDIDNLPDQAPIRRPFKFKLPMHAQSAAIKAAAAGAPQKIDPESKYLYANLVELNKSPEDLDGNEDDDTDAKVQSASEKVSLKPRSVSFNIPEFAGTRFTTNTGTMTDDKRSSLGAGQNVEPKDKPKDNLKPVQKDSVRDLPPWDRDKKFKVLVPPAPWDKKPKFEVHYTSRRLEVRSSSKVKVTEDQDQGQSSARVPSQLWLFTPKKSSSYKYLLPPGKPAVPGLPLDVGAPEIKAGRNARAWHKKAINQNLASRRLSQPRRRVDGVPHQLSFDRNRNVFLP